MSIRNGKYAEPDSYERFLYEEAMYEHRAEAYGRFKRQQFELFELDSYPECPNCGEHAEPVSFDFGPCSETGYQDAGEGCTECTKRR